MTHATGRAATRGAAARAACLTAVSSALLAACSADPTGVLKDTPHAGDTASERGNGASGVSADVIPDQYLVTFADSTRDVPGLARQLAAEGGGTIGRTYSAALKGFAGRFTPEAIEALQRNPRIVSVEQDRIVRATEAQLPTIAWGIDRVDQQALPLDSTFRFTSSGAGVSVYIIDTGIRATHQDLGARAAGVFSAIDDGNGTNDCNGHGTHVAGTVGGTLHGVAKGARLLGVRVLDCAGGGTISGIVAGIEWVTRNRVLPAVANMSVGTSASATIDQAVQNSIASGVVYAVSAGNNATDACTQSPARVAAALTVGASQADDAQAAFSNYGTCVDLYAPGRLVRSLGIATDTSTALKSGTSMSAPHVAGAAALYLQLNPAATPSSVAQALVGSATPNVLTSVGANSPNLLLYTGALATLQPSPAPTPPPAAPAPVAASFTASCQRSTCSFDASASSGGTAPYAFGWTFGDPLAGTMTTSPRTTYSFPGRGTYTITLTVTDARGARSATQRVITVKRL